MTTTSARAGRKKENATMRTIRRFNWQTDARRLLAAACAGTVLTWCASAWAQTTYSISAFGGPGCAVSSINDYADVAGQCNAVAAAWQNDVATSLGKLPNGTYSVAAAINSHGVAVGWGDNGDGRPRAELFRKATVTDIDTSAANAYAMYINETGVIVGDALKGFGGCSNWVAAIWTEDPTKPGSFRRLDLQPYPGGDGKFRCEFAEAGNQGLQVVGMVQNSLFGQRGAFWNNDSKHTLALLQTLPGDGNSYAWAVNDLGQAVGQSGNRAVFWNNDAAHTAIELPLLPGDNYGLAAAINNLGQILGTSAYMTPGTTNVTSSRTVIWRDGGVFEVESLLDPVSGNGWTITSVSGINNLGEIVGVGSYNGQATPFVMTPAAP
jgi:uncharacterized membrane protein